MGIQKSGPFGGFYKKTGPIIGRRGKGINIITALHHESTKASTSGQLGVQDRLTLLSRFLAQIKSLVNPGFKKYAKYNSPVNAAFSYNYSNAFTQTGELYELNYPSLVYSRGHVLPASSVTFKLNGDNLEFDWAPQQESMYCRNTDLATVLIYNADKGKAMGSAFETSRSEMGCMITIPPGFEGKLHCYMSFSSVDGKLVGDSRYLGFVEG